MTDGFLSGLFVKVQSIFPCEIRKMKIILSICYRPVVDLGSMFLIVLLNKIDCSIFSGG